MSEQKTDKSLTDLLSELKNDYLLKLPDKIRNLQDISAKQDWVLLEEEFHKLKGTGKTYGFPEISQLCEKMEALAQQKDTQIPGLFDQAIDLLLRMLNSYQQGQHFEIQDDPTMRTILKLKAQNDSARLKKGKG